MADHYDVPTNRLYSLRNQLLARGQRITDLVSGNVNAQGIHFPSKRLARALQLGLRRAKTYRPDPLGQLSARQAISRYYAHESVTIPESQLILTPGTSISYWYAFKVLADAGDEILCPSPSYPLFESIAALAGVALVPYRLREKTRWEIDFGHLQSQITQRTKAMVLISPHNPTGAVATPQEVQSFAEIARQRGLAIISDEVFSPFLFSTSQLARPAATTAPLVLTLNGFSKMLALPGIKIGWMGVTGEPALVQTTMKALDMISDTFLPVNEIAQFAVPALLSQSRTFQTDYASEIRRRMELAKDILKDQAGISCVWPEGGFFMALRLEREWADEEEIALRLLQKHRILIHPGYFYDMENQHLVFSWVSHPTMLRKVFTALRNEI